jgi:hypothetical protein
MRKLNLSALTDPLHLIVLLIVVCVPLGGYLSARWAGPPTFAPIPYVQQTDDGKTIVTTRVDPKTGKASAAIPKDMLPHLE